MIKFKPENKYDLLLKQAKSLYTLCIAVEKEKQFYKKKYEELLLEFKLIDRNALNAERETNKILTNLLEQ